MSLSVNTVNIVFYLFRRFLSPSDFDLCGKSFCSLIYKFTCFKYFQVIKIGNPCVALINCVHLHTLFYASLNYYKIILYLSYSSLRNYRNTYYSFSSVFYQSSHVFSCKTCKRRVISVFNCFWISNINIAQHDIYIPNQKIFSKLRN